MAEALPDSMQESMDRAVALHRAGQWAQAEALYRQILAERPDHSNALHLLGLLAFQSGKNETAVDLIRRAIVIAPAIAEYHLNLGVTLDRMGRTDHAVDSFRQALRLKPDLPEAHANLGNALRKLGRPKDAIASCLRALELRPDYLEAHLNLGNARQESGDLDGAIAAFGQVIKLRPDFAEAYFNLATALALRGQADESLGALRQAVRLKPAYHQAASSLAAGLLQKGDVDQAIEVLQNTVKIKPDFVPALVNLGHAFRHKGDLDQADRLMRQAISLQPNLPEAHLGLGTILFSKRDFDGSAVAFRQSIVLRPTLSEGHCGLANTLFAAGNHQAAIDAYHHALNVNPDHAPAYYGLGLVLTSFGQLDRAIIAFRRAASLRPNHAQSHAYLGANLWLVGGAEEALEHLQTAARLDPRDARIQNELATALFRMGRIDDAIAGYDRALAVKPDYPAAGSNRLYATLYHPAYNAAAILREHQAWNQRHAEKLKPNLPPRPGDRSPDRRLRIAYVGADLRDHVIGRMAWPIFREHDRTQFEVFCYSSTFAADAMTDLLRSHVDHYFPAAGIDDARVAEQIRGDNIDLLIDLNLHLSGGRPLVFARKPAPVSITFLGYPGTTGLSTMDWRLTDPRLDPPDKNDADYTERSYRLPDTFWCYDPAAMEWEASGPVASSQPSAPPAAKNGYVTFGSLNNFCKANDVVLKAWAAVLARTPASRLILFAPPGDPRRHASELLNLPPDRIEFVPYQGRQEYLQTYSRIDIILDAWPYNGHVTTMDALWNGVPVVSRIGATVVGRAGFSILHHLHLHNLTAESDDQFIEAAAALAADLPRLADLRATLRPRMRASPLTDAKRFTRALETAYREIWRQYLAP